MSSVIVVFVHKVHFSPRRLLLGMTPLEVFEGLQSRIRRNEKVEEYFTPDLCLKRQLLGNDRSSVNDVNESFGLIGYGSLQFSIPSLIASGAEIEQFGYRIWHQHDVQARILIAGELSLYFALTNEDWKYSHAKWQADDEPYYPSIEEAREVYEMDAATNATTIVDTDEYWDSFDQEVRKDDEEQDNEYQSPEPPSDDIEQNEPAEQKDYSDPDDYYSRMAENPIESTFQDEGEDDQVQALRSIMQDNLNVGDSTKPDPQLPTFGTTTIESATDIHDIEKKFSSMTQEMLSIARQHDWSPAQLLDFITDEIIKYQQ